MDIHKVELVLDRIALQNGTTREEVIREIEAAIDAAMQNPDPAARRRWKRLFPGGKRPSVAQFLLTMAKAASSGRGTKDL